jgi:GNAT superfamily N-acetyltransferase
VVRKGVARDRAAVISTLAAAFSADPLLRWAFPDDAVWSARAAALFGHLFDTRVEGGEIRVADDVAAVALWTPPGGNRLDKADWDRSWARATGTFAADELERWVQFVATLSGFEPHEDHWYLGVLGTRPDRQGEGLGRDVAQPVLDEADAGGHPAYLETATEANLGFYARLGFEVRDDVVIPGGPRLWGLWREPRPVVA